MMVAFSLFKVTWCLMKVRKLHYDACHGGPLHIPLVCIITRIKNISSNEGWSIQSISFHRGELQVKLWKFSSSFKLKCFTWSLVVEGNPWLRLGSSESLCVHVCEVKMLEQELRLWGSDKWTHVMVGQLHSSSLHRIVTRVVFERVFLLNESRSNRLFNSTDMLQSFKLQPCDGQ